MIVFVSNDFNPKEIHTLEDLKKHNHSDLNQNSYTMYLGDQRDLLYFMGVPEVHGNGTIFTNGSKINVFYNNLLKYVTTKTTKVVIDNSSEAPPIEYIKNVNLFFRSKGLDSCYIQSGIDNMDIDNRIFYHPHFLGTVETPYIPLNERSHHFNSLQRLVWGREHRLILTYFLHQKGLLDFGVVSCGSGESDDQFDQVIDDMGVNAPKDFVEILPLTVDDKVDIESTNTNSHRNNPGFDSIVNVISESSFNKFKSKILNGLEYKIGWSRLFFTEKTAKYINCNQLPLFMAPHGYVGRLRELGFDVFDDIINHNYDLEKNPDDRIEMISDELERLVNNMDSIINRKDLENRFRENRFTLEKLNRERTKIYNTQLREFLIDQTPINGEYYKSLVFSKNII
jgi:hypothetical protein